MPSILLTSQQQQKSVFNTKEVIEYNDSPVVQKIGEAGTELVVNNATNINSNIPKGIQWASQVDEFQVNRLRFRSDMDSGNGGKVVFRPEKNQYEIWSAPPNLGWPRKGRSYYMNNDIIIEAMPTLANAASSSASSTETIYGKTYTKVECVEIVDGNGESCNSGSPMSKSGEKVPVKSGNEKTYWFKVFGGDSGQRFCLSPTDWKNGRKTYDILETLADKTQEFPEFSGGWFYFGVRNAANHVSNSTHDKDSKKPVRFVIRNMKQLNLDEYKYLPWMRIVDSNSENGNKGSSAKWERVDASSIEIEYENVEIVKNKPEKRMKISFDVEIPADENISIEIAHNAPYSYTELQKFLDTVDEAQQEMQEMSDDTDDSISYTRETLCKSHQGRNVDLLTITSKKEDANVDKKFVFFSARCHPSETPGQFALEGVIKFLLSNDEKAIEMREKFIFKIVPMLNPDGVSLGHFRVNSIGLDLNRCYRMPVDEDLAANHANANAIAAKLDPEESIAAVMRLLKGLGEKLAFYMDFHSYDQKVDHHDKSSIMSETSKQRRSMSNDTVSTTCGSDRASSSEEEQENVAPRQAPKETGCFVYGNVLKVGNGYDDMMALKCYEDILKAKRIRVKQPKEKNANVTTMLPGKKSAAASTSTSCGRHAVYTNFCTHAYTLECSNNCLMGDGKTRVGTEEWAEDGINSILGMWELMKGNDLK